MGAFYTNISLRGPSQETVAQSLQHRDRVAFVSPSDGGAVVVYDQECDKQDQELLARLALDLSRELQCPALALLNHDDDILWYQLYERGKLVDEYDSCPSYFDPVAEPSGPVGGDAEKLCNAFGGEDVGVAEQILRKSGFEDGGYAFATDRHRDLAAAAGLPQFSVGSGYGSIEYDELPDGLEKEQLASVK